MDLKTKEMEQRESRKITCMHCTRHGVPKPHKHECRYDPEVVVEYCGEKTPAKGGWVDICLNCEAVDLVVEDQG